MIDKLVREPRGLFVISESGTSWCAETLTALLSETRCARTGLCRPEEMAESSAPITSYYDSLTDEEIAEDRAWGDFALMQFRTAESIRWSNR